MPGAAAAWLRPAHRVATRAWLEALYVCCGLAVQEGEPLLSRQAQAAPVRAVYHRGCKLQGVQRAAVVFVVHNHPLVLQAARHSGLAARARFSTALATAASSFGKGCRCCRTCRIAGCSCGGVSCSRQTRLPAQSARKLGLHRFQARSSRPAAHPNREGQQVPPLLATMPIGNASAAPGAPRLARKLVGGPRY
jgi:hypothetical protein